MNPLDFIQTASNLQLSTQESDCRSAVSRAYYGIFNHAFQRIRPHVASMPVGGRKHAAVHYYLAGTTNPDLQAVAQRLWDLRNRRNHADYEMHRTFRSKDAVWAVKNAQAVEATLAAVNPQVLISELGNVPAFM